MDEKTNICSTKLSIPSSFINEKHFSHNDDIDDIENNVLSPA